jgi:hypothetical protein
MLISREKLNEFLQFDLKGKPQYDGKIIGNGTVGGKAKGLFFAKEVVENSEDPPFPNMVVPESMFVTTEVFDSFIDENNLYDIARKAEKEEIPYELVEEAFVKGVFNPMWKEEFQRILSLMTYPLAIRSSSNLEDSVKYAFAGKYLTTYITNQGTMDERLAQLEKAIKRVFASTFGPNAVAYRAKHKLSGEKMAIIVQKLLGKDRGGFFYPEIAGVGFSKNYRRWTERINAEDGVVRIVFGLGTRCTERGYARTYSLTNPSLRPEGNNAWEIAKYSQETYDSIHMGSGNLVSYNINSKLETLNHHRLYRQFVQKYTSSENFIEDVSDIPTSNSMGQKLIMSFDGIIKTHRRFFSDFKKLFHLLEQEMGIAVDIEFTYELDTDTFGLIQARPLCSWEEYRRIPRPDNLKSEDIILYGDRMLTNGHIEDIEYMVYVDHDQYYSRPDKFSVAREIGKVNRRLTGNKYILVGPGRWGSSNMMLGVPVNYNEISNCLALIELGISSKNFAPELSYGTHFFSDLDVDGVLYMPVFDNVESNVINTEWFNRYPFEPTGHPAVRLYKGPFNIYFDGHKMEGLVILKNRGL